LWPLIAATMAVIAAAFGVPMSDLVRLAQLR
jgi:hypothetical protein